MSIVKISRVTINCKLTLMKKHKWGLQSNCFLVLGFWFYKNFPFVSHVARCLIKQVMNISEWLGLRIKGKNLARLFLHLISHRFSVFLAKVSLVVSPKFQIVYSLMSKFVQLFFSNECKWYVRRCEKFLFSMYKSLFSSVEVRLGSSLTNKKH